MSLIDITIVLVVISSPFRLINLIPDCTTLTVYNGNPTPRGNIRNLVNPRLTSYYPMKALFTFQKNLLIIILNNIRYSLIKRTHFIQKWLPICHSHKLIEIFVSLRVHMKFRLQRSHDCCNTHIDIPPRKVNTLILNICLHILILLILYFMNQAYYLVLFAKLF